MKRTIPAIAIVTVVALAATGTGVALLGNSKSNSTPTIEGHATSVTEFIKSMEQTKATRFVASYRLDGYLFFQNGTIVIAQIPSPPGTKVKTNVDGYSGTGRYAYIFRGLTGRIAQWIKNGTNVSACMNAPVAGNFDTGNFGKLQCSRPSPYIPSNGFAEADAGFVPTYVLQAVTGLVESPSQRKPTITVKPSQEFGPLKCLAQFSGPTTQTTCINHAGFVATWLLQNGSHFISRATLTSINHQPTADDFKTLLPPTKPFMLPAV